MDKSPGALQTPTPTRACTRATCYVVGVNRNSSRNSIITVWVSKGPCIPHSIAQAAPESEPESGPKQKQPALPMQALTATGKAKMNKLSPEQIAELKEKVDDAVKTTSKDKVSKRKGQEVPAASSTKNDKDGEQGTRPPRAPRGTYARKAAQALLDSLATPAPPAKKPSSKAKAGHKKDKVNKGKGKVKEPKAELKKAPSKVFKANKSDGNTDAKAGYST